MKMLFVSNTIEKTVFKAVLCAFLICLMLSMISFDAESQAISEEVLRLHILADSDSAEDQALKLKVRDRIQELCADIFSQCDSETDAENIVEKRLPEILSAASEVVRENGGSDVVRGELVNMYFTTRTYDNITLPAGNYNALRITIGSGSGHNWWCVMFPPICVGAASDVNISDVLNDDQTELVTSNHIEYKFKIYELYENLVNKF